MPVAPQARAVHFRAAGDIVNRAPHVGDVFPRQTLPVDDLHRKQIVLEIAPIQRAALVALAETSGVRAEDDVAFARERHAGVVHRRALEARGLRFANRIGAVVLMPDADARRAPFGGSGVRDEQVRGDALGRLYEVCDALEAVAVFLRRALHNRLQRAVIRPRAAEAGEQFLFRHTAAGLTHGHGGLLANTAGPERGRHRRARGTAEELPA
jgi:hypothetical protein